MGQNPRALWWWLSDLVSLSSVETHIPNSLMVSCPPPLCIRSRARKPACISCVSCLSFPEMSLALGTLVSGMAWASLFRQLSNWLWKPVEWLVEAWQGLCIFLSHALKKALDCSCVGDYQLHLAIKKKYCKFPPKLVLSSFWGLCGLLQFFFLLRSPINILCRRTWLISHSGGYMSKPHLDSWVKYTRQRNLWGPEPLTCGMKRSRHPVLSSTPPTPAPPHQPQGCPLWVVTPWSLTSSPREDWMLFGYMALLWKVWSVWSHRQRASRVLKARAEGRCPCKGMPCLSAASSCPDLRRIDSCEDSGFTVEDSYDPSLRNTIC